MNTVCRYAIIRFLPFAETGEFANTGVVLICPERHYVSYKLNPRGWSRLSKFFEDLDSRIYRRAHKLLEQEIRRVTELCATDRWTNTGGKERWDWIFGELVKPRDGVIRFSQPRVVLAQDPAQKLDELFGFYVQRDFVTKEYQEKALTRNVRRVLLDASLAERYRPQTIGDDVLQVNFPFVWMKHDRPHKAIKPLHLAHGQASDILDHGGHWVERVRRLKKHGHMPDGVLFAVKSPENEGTASEPVYRRSQAAREIIMDLQSEGATTAEVGDAQAIVSFARW